MHYHLPPSLLRARTGTGRLQAELSPVMLVAVPMVVVLASHGSSVLVFPTLILSMLGVAGAHLILGQIVRELGERCKERLNAQYGRPAIQLLMQSTRGNSTSLYIESIAHRSSQLGLPIPAFPTGRHAGRARAGDYVAALGLIEETLGWSKMRALQTSRVLFEFLLNCLALRAVGMISSVGALLLAVIDPASAAIELSPNGRWSFAISVRPDWIQQALLPAIMLVGWVVAVTARRVHRVQSRYDRILLVAVARATRNRHGMTRRSNSSRRAVANTGNGAHTSRSTNR